MLKTILRPLAGATILILLASFALVTAPAEAGDDDGKKMKIKKIHRVCEGENCEDEGGHRAIFIGEGGDLHELGDMTGEDLVWIGGGDHGDHMMSGTYLGVQLTELTDELRAHFGVPEGQGVMVSKVVDGSPAAIAGVEVGDVVTAVDGELVKSGGSLGHMIRQREEGETVALEVYRDGRVEGLSPTLAKREGRMKARRMHAGPGAMHKMHTMHGMGSGMHKIMVKCDEEDGEEDCEVTMGDVEGIAIGDFDCGGAEECKVQVRCDDDGCECTANGDAVDCNELPGFAERHGG